MARTSKTVIGGGSGEQSDRMMRAAESGQNARQRAHSEHLAQMRAGGEQANQTAAVAGNVVGQGEERKAQREQFAERHQLDKEALELDAQKAGFERTPKGQGPQGQQGAQGDRAKQLEAEMAKGQGQPKLGPLDPQSQQRLNDQVQDSSMEMDAHGTWRPNAERRGRMEREQKRKDFQADTERIRAEAYRDQVGVQAQKAYAAGDTKEFERLAKESAALPNSTQKLYDRVKDGDIDDTDWPGIAKAAKGSEEFDPSLMNDITAKKNTPRVQAFLRSQVQVEAIKSIIRTGSDSDLKIDWTYPQMREFVQTRDSINDFAKANPALTSTAMIRNTADKMRFINQTAAMQVLFRMSQPASPTGGATPAMRGSEGGAGALPAAAAGGRPMGPGERQMAATSAVRGARQAGDSPSESLAAGQAVDPTAAEPDSKPFFRSSRLEQ